MEIKVFGSCCSKCEDIYKYVNELIFECKEKCPDMKITAEKVNDVAAQMQYGIMSLPALVIDDKVVSSGRMISKKEVAEFIDKACGVDCCTTNA